MKRDDMRDSRKYILGGLCLLVASSAFAIQPLRAEHLSPQAIGLFLIASGCIAFGILRMRNAAIPKGRSVTSPTPVEAPAIKQRFGRSAQTPQPAPPPGSSQERVTMETLSEEAKQTLSDKRNDAEYLDDILAPMSPLWLLNSVMAQVTRQAPREPSGRFWKSVGLSSTRGIGATPEEIGAMNAQADARRAMLDSSPVFRATLARLTAVGVLPEWGEDGEYSFRARILRLVVPLEAISQIQEMVADDAGIESPQERLEAAEIYRRWLLQSYQPDWQQYREQWPTLYENPNNTARNDYGRAANPTLNPSPSSPSSGKGTTSVNRLETIEMNDCVWISTAPGHASNMRPLKHSFSNDEQRKVGLEWAQRNIDGEPLTAEFFPDEIWGISSARPSAYNLPNLFRAGDVWAVSALAADVLRQFDLGGGGLYPVKVMKKDRATPVGGEWFCLNFGNRKNSFLPEQSSRFRHDYIRNGQKGWFPRLPCGDYDLSVSSAALDGPDVWVDPDVGDAFFLSDALAKALKNAKADKGFFLAKCRVL